MVWSVFRRVAAVRGFVRHGIKLARCRKFITLVCGDLLLVKSRQHRVSCSLLFLGSFFEVSFLYKA